MSITEKFKKGNVVFSLEVFPPKKDSSVDTIYKTLEQLSDVNPDFISVTYGAGGKGAVEKTCDIATTIRDKYNITPMAHLTCVNNTKEEVKSVLDKYKEQGIENILALRGDINPDIEPKTDFKYASDLVEFINENYPNQFNLSGACYPEVHMDAENEVEDILNLKKKVDFGVTHLISQLFFDNDAFYRFKERADIAGIKVPIEAGIMPVVNSNQIQNMVSKCGASLPIKFSRMMQKYDGKPEALRDAGIAYAINQIVDLISNGVEGIHLYTMNNPYVARQIAFGIKNLL